MTLLAAFLALLVAVVGTVPWPEAAPHPGRVVAAGIGGHVRAGASMANGTEAVDASTSFSPDTPVLTYEHGRVAISEVHQGDRAWSCDDATGQACGWRRVQQVIVHQNEGTWRLQADGEDGQVLVVDVTANHPVFVVGRGFVPVEEIEAGEEVAGVDGERLVVSGMWPLRGEGEVYNLTVAVGHTYFVGGEDAAAWVHNTKGGAGSRGVSGAGGVITTTENAAGGRVVSAVGDITQRDVATHVNSALIGGGDVHVLSGVHGTPEGRMIPEASFFADDVAKFGQYPGVTVSDVSKMTSAEITGALASPGTTIGAFCNSGPCLGIK